MAAILGTISPMGKCLASRIFVRQTQSAFVDPL